MCSLGAPSESRLDSSLTSEKKKKGTLRKKVKKVNKFMLVTHQVRDVMSETVEIEEIHPHNETYSEDENSRNSGTASASSPQN